MKTCEVVEYVQASAMIASGAMIEEVKPPVPGGRKCRIIFRDDDGLASKLAREHESGRLQVNSLAFGAALSNVKSRLFAARG